MRRGRFGIGRFPPIRAVLTGDSCTPPSLFLIPLKELLSIGGNIPRFGVQGLGQASIVLFVNAGNTSTDYWVGKAMGSMRSLCGV